MTAAAAPAPAPSRKRVSQVWQDAKRRRAAAARSTVAAALDRAAARCRGELEDDLVAYEDELERVRRDASSSTHTKALAERAVRLVRAQLMCKL